MAAEPRTRPPPARPSCPIEAAVIAGFIAGAILVVLATWVFG